jgi:hypothetical protein
MTTSKRAHRPLALAAGLLLLAPLCLSAANAAAGESAGEVSPATQLIEDMAGSWSVKEWMWPARGAHPIELPRAMARRELIDGKFLEETMTSLPGAPEPFTRIACFDYNTVSGRYEYFSLDTRAPQMMNERSVGRGNPDGQIWLHGPMFVAPQWGPARNAAFRYALALGPIRGNSQTVELYLTPIPASAGGQFLAFKYVYTRRPANGSRS